MRLTQIGTPPHIDSLPVVFLWPFSGCDCKCVMCDIGKDHSRRKLDISMLAGWLPDWRKLGVKRVAFTGGEALLHSGIWDMCRLLADNDIGVELLSTGLTMRRHVDEIVQYCDAITVSLDGPPPVHNLIRRVPKAYELLEQSVGELRKRDPGFEINGRSTVQRANYDRMRQTVDTARDLGLSRISFLATDVTSSAFNRPDGWDAARQSDIALGPTDIEPLELELHLLESQHRTDFESGFILESPELLRTRLLDYYKAHNGLIEFPPVSCNAPWTSAVVLYDGSVQPCFFHKAYEAPENRERFTEVVNGESAIGFRKSLDIATDETCRRCVCSFNIDNGAVG